ncbi:MAG: M20/M25/M40 family metallo-hydrolase [Chloroflexi bacterium]|nr:M20/M25/M40 family metallo-hydrolase [Chloroflexota bacterium]
MIDQPRLLETLRAFIAAPSPQNDLAQVRAFIADVVRPRLPVAFFDRVAIDADGNLVALKRGHGGEKPFLLCGYGATFPAESMAEAFVPREVDGAAHGIPGPAVQGRGVSEQVAALAAAVEALQALAEAGPRLERGLIFTTTIAGEMGSHEVVDAMAQRGDLEAGSGMLAIGSNNALCLGNMGRVDVHLEVRGRSCHSSDPSRGVNAIEGACRAVERLRTVPLAEDPELGRSTLTPTHLETWPKAMHTLPDLARMILDRRLVPGEEIAAAIAGIAAALQPMEPFEVEVRAGKFNYPNKVSPEAEVAVATRQALLEVAGAAPVVYWRATLDAGYFTRRGIPTIIFGPGDTRLAHTTYELVSIRQVVEAAEVYRRVLVGMCG